MPARIVSPGFGRSISARIVRVEGSTDMATRVTVAEIADPPGPPRRNSAFVPTRTAAAPVSGTSQEMRTTSSFWQVNSGIPRPVEAFCTRSPTLANRRVITPSNGATTFM